MNLFSSNVPSDISSHSHSPTSSVPPELLSFQDIVTPSLTSEIPGISLQNGFRLRVGQEAFLRKLAGELQHGEASHLGVFVPGYGKTITALSSFSVARALGIAQKLVVFVPRGNLRDQYADARELSSVFRNIGAPAFTFCVADSERVFLKNLQTDIIITTYQYASGKAGSAALRRFCETARCMFVLDEVHHLSEDGSWAGSIATFPFACSIALSGTPMRSDNKTLFGVPSEVRIGLDGRPTQFYKPLHETLLRDAHAEGNILKRVAMHVIDYTVKLKNTTTGEIVELALDKLRGEANNAAEVDAFLARKKLRFHEVYLDALLRPAFERFSEKRRMLDLERSLERMKQGATQSKPNTDTRQHQMLVIAMSNLHSAAMLEYIRQHFPEVKSGRIGQDVPEDERLRLLQDYREGRLDVMVQVDMIGEGTDIKPISVIVKADLVRALSKTMQQVFRGMRYYAGFGEEANVCDIYASNDAELVQILEWITNEEQIGVHIRQKRDADTAITRTNTTPQGELWQLADVQQQSIETHSLVLFDGFMRPTPVVKRSAKKSSQGAPIGALNAQNTDAAQQALSGLNIAERERELRQECSLLAVRLGKIIAPTDPAAVSRVHGAAIRKFSKTQEKMSIPELLQKREWLQKSLVLGRLV
ncbi:MAG: helicase [Candidatus Kapaibacterium sp.]|nr:MAG: helicase [Candidatus Kapabacteria bacterium]